MKKVLFCLKDTIISLIFILCVITGCASVPYKYGKEIENEKTYMLREGESQIVRGRPVAFIDGLGHYVLSLPSKLILWNWKVDNHDISLETEEKIEQYLTDNDLYNVKVRLNQYAPGAEYRRLFKNRTVGAGWRYTLGILTVTSYTIMPGRAFGGDNYNPHTNTINIYSDHPSIVIHEGGHAKDTARRTYKGWYSVLRILPLVPLYQEAIATSDAIGYDREKCIVQEEKSDYKILYPAYGTYIAGEGLQWVDASTWVSYAVSFGGALIGHVVGRTKALFVQEQPFCKERWEKEIEMEMRPDEPVREEEIVSEEAEEGQEGFDAFGDEEKISPDDAEEELEHPKEFEDEEKTSSDDLSLFLH